MSMISFRQVSFSFHALKKRDDFLMKANMLIILQWLLLLLNSSSNDPIFLCSFLKFLKKLQSKIKRADVSSLLPIERGDDVLDF